METLHQIEHSQSNNEDEAKATGKNLILNTNAYNSKSHNRKYLTAMQRTKLIPSKAKRLNQIYSVSSISLQKSSDTCICWG